MNYGLYLSASGVLTNLYRQDVFANNLANVQTVGFKPDRPAIHQRAPEAVEAGLGMDVHHDLLERLGGGVLAGPQRIDFKIGSPTRTQAPLDVMLDGDDTFFVVEANDPTGDGPSSLRFTRDGRFQLDGDGYLVTTTGGHRVLDTNDQPIVVDATGPVRIDPDGYLIQGEEVGSRIQVTAVRDRDQLIKAGHNLFEPLESGDIRVPATNERVRPGFVESSAVDAVQAMLKVVQAAKAVTGNGNMIRYHDLMMERAVNTLGRVVA